MDDNQEPRPAHIAILGAGPAGLALGYYAKKSGIRFTIYEAHSKIGGGCITLEHGDFLFDSGAHRLHDKDAEVAEEIKKLLGEELKHIDVPSQIYHKGEFIDFPLSPGNLMRHLGLFTFFKAGLEVMSSRLRHSDFAGNFERFALRTYGKTVAERFLLNYSEKLWGLPSHRLSTGIAAKRMKGLDLTTFLMETFMGSKAKTRHLDGTFYYPDRGIGAIAEALAAYCGNENILRNSRITKLLHNHKRIQTIEINGKQRIDADFIVSTLPIDELVLMMEPKLPERILSLARSFRYRNLILVALFLKRESVTEAATIYFPDAEIPFTRLYEPRNRSPYMSPPGKTSLVAELPCQQDDSFWSLDDDKLIHMVRSKLIELGWIEDKEIIDATVCRINRAYPKLELGFEEKLQNIVTFLGSFKNMKISGRNGRFFVASIHDVMRWGKDIIQEFVSDREEFRS